MRHKYEAANKHLPGVPPYLSYKTFCNFIDRLRGEVPSRVDRSVMAEMSGSTRSHLMATLRYLELTSSKGLPSGRLLRLAKATGIDRERVLREIVISSYPFLFKGFDLEKATGRQIEEKFVTVGASGETVRRCVAFFLSAAKEARIPLSPFLKPVRKTRRGAIRKRTSQTGEFNSPAMGPDQGWKAMLLSKFPSLDPAWPDEIKSKWFDAFEKLMKSADRKAALTDPEAIHRE